MISKKDYQHKELTIHSSKIIVPRGTYQRSLSASRVKKIADSFDERIANPPKISKRDNKYYVFDGQHTIAARKLLNDGKDLPIQCKVYFDMNEKEEALLFAQQTGTSARLSPGVRIRALIFGEDAEAVAFNNAVESLGLKLDFDHKAGKYRISSVGTAFEAYKRIGEEKFKEAMSIIIAAWHGEPKTIVRANVTALTRFIDLYKDDYDRGRLIAALSVVDPLFIGREGKLAAGNLFGYKKYLYQVYRIYNGCKKQYSLPMKF